MERSRKRERARLQAAWRRLGWTYDRIATEFQRRYHVGPLTAYRWAHCLPQGAVADHYNLLIGDDERPIVLQTISDWERGIREPSITQLNRLARVYQTATANLIAGEDFRHLDPAHNGDGNSDSNGAEPTVTSTGLYLATSDLDDLERYSFAVKNPERVDERVVGYLARVLAEHRRADDLFGPRGMLPAINGQLNVIESFIDNAEPKVRQSVLSVACQYAQFLGWMYQDAAQHDKAAYWYAKTEEWALESGNLPMVATSLSLKADQAWAFNKPYATISLAQAAQRDEWRSPPGLRALTAQEEAGGHALLHALTRDPNAAEASLRKLDEIREWVAAMQEGHEPEMPWTYFFTPDFSRMQRASVLRTLGRAEEAIPLFEEGIAKLPSDDKRGRGQYLARISHAYFLAGDTQTALSKAEESGRIAHETGSGRTVEELQRLKQTIAAAGARHALRRIEELLRSITGPPAD